MSEEASLRGQLKFSPGFSGSLLWLCVFSESLFMFTRNGRKIQRRDFTKGLVNGQEIAGKKDRGIAKPNRLLNVDRAVDGYQH